MGKKRIIKKEARGVSKDTVARSLSKLPKKKMDKIVLHIRATYNNTLLTLTDDKGKVVMWSSAGALGFKGARKGTPYAASKVAELLAEKSKLIGVKNADIFVTGVGSGRESAIRSFAAQGIVVDSIKDVTPLPHNGVRPPKPRRV